MLPQTGMARCSGRLAAAVLSTGCPWPLMLLLLSSIQAAPTCWPCLQGLCRLHPTFHLMA